MTTPNAPSGPTTRPTQSSANTRRRVGKGMKSDAQIDEGDQKKKIEESRRQGLCAWKRSEYPVLAGQADPLGRCDEESSMFSRRGREFLGQALEFGAVRSEERHRDRRIAYFYGRKLDRKTNSAEAAFGEALGELTGERR